MITVIDRTLSLLSNPQNPEALVRLMKEMYALGADVLEISEDIYSLLDGNLPEGKYILRLNHGSSPASFKGIKRFVSTASASGNVVMSEEYFLRNPESIYAGSVPSVLRPVRLSISTPDYLPDFSKFFSAIRKTFLGHIEFAPFGDAGIATSIAAEWILADGNCTVTTLGGVCGYPSLEEILVFLRSVRRRRPSEGQMASQERMDLLKKVFSDEVCGKADSVMKVCSSNSIHVLKFKLGEIGYSENSEILRKLAGQIRSGNQYGGAFVGNEEIAQLTTNL